MIRFITPFRLLIGGVVSLTDLVSEIREATKKCSFLSGRANKRGGRLNGCVTKEKRFFFNVRKKFLWWGGAKGLSGRATKKITFFAAYPRNYG